ncbi:MAG: rubrerythrin family protein [Deltaproteobacteria bacterium]|nr:rubrerythrin family protein [Deltaproteobacteria bacterium]
MKDQTLKNLETAFAGECQAFRRYMNFAIKADAEGFSHVARLFRAAAESEAIHATNHLKAMQGIGSTAENVEAALKGEVDEFDAMYPMFIDQARRDANNDALNSFFWANEAEKQHGAFYERALAAVKAGKDAEMGELYICQVCGYTVEGEPPDKCPACGKDKKEFVPVK